MHHRPSRIHSPMGAAFICAALMLFAVSAYGLTARAYAQSSSRLDGLVLDGTASAPPARVANLDVTLFQIGASGPVTRTAQTDAQGRFAFMDLNLDPNGPYFARVNYQGIQYFSDILTPGTETSTPISLTVYETQTVPADFQIDRTHFILDVDQSALTGIELLQVKNQTDRAFLLPMPLPENLASLQFNDPRDQFRAVERADGSLDFPVLPTTDQILLGVRVTTSPPQYTLLVKLPVRVGRLNVLVSQAAGVQVASPMLKPGAVFTPQNGSSYWQLNGDDIPGGSTVAVVISNLPGAGNSGMVRTMVLGLGGLAALALLSLPFVRRRRTHVPPAVQGDAPPSFSLENSGGAGVDASERLERLKAIAELDDAFEAGEIPEEDYRVHRAALKSEMLNDPNPQA